MRSIRSARSSVPAVVCGLLSDVIRFSLARPGRYKTVAYNLRVKEAQVAPGGDGDGDEGVCTHRFVCHNQSRPSSVSKTTLFETQRKLRLRTNRYAQPGVSKAVLKRRVSKVS